MFLVVANAKNCVYYKQGGCMLNIENISYKVQNAQREDILQNISLSFPENKITVITGPNGSGKSTLLKLIAGILQPTSGKICLNKQDITPLSVTKRAKLGITLAWQQPVKFKGITVKQLLTFANPNCAQLSTACSALARVGLCAKNYVNRLADESLSGGELKRIELACALAKGGHILLFDEPEAGIDLWSFTQLTHMFTSIQNATIIIVSHQAKILEIADYICLFQEDGSAILDTKQKLLPKIQQTPTCQKLQEEV